MPEPVSVTSRQQYSPGASSSPGRTASNPSTGRRAVEMLTVPLLVSPMASAAFITRFMITCWNWPVSTLMAGRSSARSSLSSIDFGMESRTRWTMPRTSAERSASWMLNRALPA